MNDVLIRNSNIETIASYLERLEYRKVNLTPDYQREAHAWSPSRKKSFIEDLIKYRGLNHPFILASVDCSPNQLELFDGAQRTKCIQEYINGQGIFKDKNQIDISQINVKIDTNRYPDVQTKREAFITINQSVVKMDKIDILLSERSVFPGLMEIFNNYKIYSSKGLDDKKKKKFVAHIVGFSAVKKCDNIPSIYKTLRKLDENEVSNKIVLGKQIYDILTQEFHDNQHKLVTLKCNIGAMFIGRLLSKDVSSTWIKSNTRELVQYYDAYDKMLVKEIYTTRRLGMLQQRADTVLEPIQEFTKVRKHLKVDRDFKGSTGYEADHIVPLTMGGEDNLDNMQMIKMSENRSKGSKLPA